MTPIEEVVSILRAVAAAMVTAAQNEASREGADVRRAAGEMVDRAAIDLGSNVIGSKIQAAARATTAAGCTLEGIEQIAAVATAATVRSPVAIAVRLTCLRLSLVEMARIVAGIRFRSREDVQTVTARVNAAFAPAEDEAADRGEHEVYRDLVALHAAVIRDMVQRGRPLPRLVPYRTATRQPSLVLSNRLYGVADRADELVGENRAVHPLFMPAAGRALSS